MNKITVNASGKYDICIGSAIMTGCFERLYAAKGGRRCLIVTDSNVFDLYLQGVSSMLSDAGFEVCACVIPAGEKSKNLNTLGVILNAAASCGLTRSDFMAALGGGVTGDITGLAAALYMRGISYIQIPTTLVACVDSSVGGKCAVDLEAGKNLAGVFHQPEAVICDVSLMRSLPETEFSCGMAEVIKYGAGFDAVLFEMTKGDVKRNLTEIVTRCISIKKKIVEHDEFDRGERMKLNLGHTIGHAIEKCSGYTVPHGMAVGKGLYAICKAYGVPFADEVRQALEKNGIDISVNFTAKELASAAYCDKKRSGDNISVIIPREIGVCEIGSIPADDAEKLFAGGLV